VVKKKNTKKNCIGPKGLGSRGSSRAGGEGPKIKERKHETVQGPWRGGPPVTSKGKPSNWETQKERTGERPMQVRKTWEA